MADFFDLHAHVDGDPAKATVFLVDKDTPGVRLVRTPAYMHTFVFEHPIFAFEGVRLSATTPCSARSARASSSRRTGSSRSG